MKSTQIADNMGAQTTCEPLPPQIDPLVTHLKFHLEGLVVAYILKHVGRHVTQDCPEPDRLMNVILTSLRRK